MKTKKSLIITSIAIGAVLIALGVILYEKAGRSQMKENYLSSELPQQAESQDIVELADGDEYTIHVAEVKKTIESKEYAMLAYNGSIPGPLLVVPQHAKVNITLSNDMDIPTTLHAHGIRMNNAFDGVPGVTQKEILPGESFTYELTFPDAGMFWYHPHLREDYTQELGLYGNIMVRPADSGVNAPVNQEWIAMIDDIDIQNGAIAVPKERVDHTLMGRFGNVMLVNGETGYRWEANNGDVVRLYLTNVANTRVFALQIPGARMKLVGGDSGFYEQERWIDSVLLAPSERAMVDVFFERAGTFTLEHRTPDKTYPLATIDVSNTPTAVSYAAAFDSLAEHKDTKTQIAALEPYMAVAPQKRLALSVAMKRGGGMMGTHMMHGGQVMQDDMMAMDAETEKIEWEDDMGMMNAAATQETLEWRMTDLETGDVNDKIDWRFSRGDVIKIEIQNPTTGMHPMQHPIHLHGQRFLVVSTNGIREQNLVWKDTVLVQTGDTVELLVEMTNPGRWPLHCHIPEHMESGMMSFFTVSE